MNRLASICVTVLLPLLLTTACAIDDDGVDADFPYTDDAAGGKGEEWNSANDPIRVDRTFTAQLDQLPRTGAATRTPWTGDYWATAFDSINARWDGASSMSPAEKWERAFGRAGFVARVTQELGATSVTGATCSTDAQCADDEACAKPRGAASGRCIPTWFGICHGWAPAAIAVPQATKAVVKNGVTFYPGDLEALMSAAWSGEDYSVKFISERCDADALPTDSYGRIRAGECRDMNPGSFHVVIGNMLGKRGLAIVEDRTADGEVWNQPVASYKVTKQTEVTEAQAAALVGLAGSSYTYNADAARFVSVETDLKWITESEPSRRARAASTYTRTTKLAYVLELDAAGTILGGEWVGASKTNHPDFLWWPTSTPRTEAVRGLKYSEIKALYDQAR